MASQISRWKWHTNLPFIRGKIHESSVQLIIKIIAIACYSSHLTASVLGEEYLGVLIEWCNIVAQTRCSTMTQMLVLCWCHAVEKLSECPMMSVTDKSRLQTWKHSNLKWTEMHRIGYSVAQKKCFGFPVSKFLGSVFSFRPRVLAQVTSLWTDFWIISFLASIAWQDRNECHCCGALATFEKCIETSNPI